MKFGQKVRSLSVSVVVSNCIDEEPLIWETFLSEVTKNSALLAPIADQIFEVSKILIQLVLLKFCHFSIFLTLEPQFSLATFICAQNGRTKLVADGKTFQLTPILLLEA